MQKTALLLTGISLVLVITCLVSCCCMRSLRMKIRVQQIQRLAKPPAAPQDISLKKRGLSEVPLDHMRDNSHDEGVIVSEHQISVDLEGAGVIDLSRN